MRRTVLARLAVAVVLSGALPAQALARQSLPAARITAACPAPTTISFMFWGDFGEKREQDAAVRMARHACSDVRIKEIWDRGNYDADLADMISRGRSPDVFQIDAQKYLAYYAAQGSLAKLDPYLERARLDPSHVYWPACIREAQYRGHIWGLPRDCSNQGILFYNKDMFDARHVAYPTEHWSYLDFLRAGQELTGDYPVRTDGTSRLRFGYAWNEDDFRINQYMWQWGGDWLTGNLKRCTLTSKPVRRAFTWWRDLRYRYHAAPTDQQAVFSGDNVGGFKEQRYAMTFAGAWALNYMLKPNAGAHVSSPRFRWGAVRTPTGPRSRQAVIDVALEVVARRSRHPDAAWWFVKFLSAGQAGPLVGAFGIGIPAAVEFRRAPAVRHEYGSLLPLFLSTVHQGRSMRTVRRYPLFWTTVRRDLEPMWRDTESVSRATRRACHDVADLLP